MYVYIYIERERNQNRGKGWVWGVGVGGWGWGWCWRHVISCDTEKILCWNSGAQLKKKCNFQGWSKCKRKFSRISKSKVLFCPGFSRVKSGIFGSDQEKDMLHFHESWFSTLYFSRGVTQFYRISKGKESFVLSIICKGKITNLKNPGFYFFKSMSSIPPLWIFLE